ncbi:MAG: DUF177 domain-containing protein [Candidatus Eisenbacteria sp.]|nr:DUF177 domain-containing protein [Candidatus Eisenbacteria bacterium]
MGKFVLDLRDLKDGKSTRSLVGDVESLDLSRDEYVFHSPVRVELEVTRSEYEISVVGEILVTAQVECARCACVSTREIVADLRARYIRVRGKSDWNGRSEHAGVFRIQYDEGVVDLSEEICQSVLVSLPMRALCTSDCKGLCPSCGANLNEGQCSCRRTQSHPAWAALEKLKDIEGQ